MDKELVEVHSWADVPKFSSEREEAEYWSTHAFGEELLIEDPVGDPLLSASRSRTSPVSIRFDGDTLARLKTLARRRHKGYQSMLKEFVSERLYEEEKREGIIGDSKAS